MSDDRNKHRPVSRRNLLRTSSIAGAASLTIFGQTVSAVRKTGKGLLDDVETIPEVQSILGELGYERIPRSYSASKTDFESDSADASVTAVDFGYGTLHVVDIEESILASFVFDSTDELSSDQYRNIPTEPLQLDCDVWLHGLPADTLLYRTATPEERDAILSAVPADEDDDVSIYTHENLDGFYVEAIESERSDSEGAVATQERQLTTYLATVDGDELRVGAVSAERVSTGDVGIQVIRNPAKRAAELVARQFAKALGWNSIDQVDDSCGAKVGACLDGLWSTIDCYKCRPICALGLTGKAAVICFLCIFATCMNIDDAAGCANAARCIESP